MGTRFDYEIIILGGGVAGSAAARLLAAEGHKVAVVEKRHWGGSGLNTRDVPYHACQTFAHLYAQAVAGVRFGISSTNLRYNYPTVSQWRTKAVMRSAVGNMKKDLEESGVACIEGRAQFVGPHEITVADKTYSAAKFLITTGASAVENDIVGLETVPYLTPDTALKLERLPRTMMVVGAGSSGIELAEYFAELGVKVAIAELSDRLLPKEDEEVGQIMEKYFDKRLGVKVLTKTRVVEVRSDAMSPKVVLLQNGREKTVRVECVACATGSRPMTDLGLENTGVKYSPRGVAIDKTLQTSVKHIFAAGDVVGGDSSTEVAEYEASVAVNNLVSRSKTSVNYSGFMRVVDTDPQVATVGMNEDDLIKRDIRYHKSVLPLSAAVRSNTEDMRLGFVKLLADNQGKILGATMVAPGAAAVLQEISMCIRHGIPVVEVASTPHVAGEWGQLLQLAAKQLLKG